MNGARREAWLLAFATAGIVFLLWQLLDFAYGRDQGIYATVARTLREGGVPYRDAWDFKPPAIFFAYALADAVAGSGPRAIRILEAACLISLVPACALLARRYVGDPRAGVLSAALAILVYVQSEFWDTAQPESFGGVCVIWGLALFALTHDTGRAPGRRDLVLWATSGLLFGVASLFKPTVGIAAAAPIAFAFADLRRRPGRSPRAQVARFASAFGAGLLAPAVACALFFAVHGAFGGLWDTLVVFAPRYTAVSWQSGPASLVANVFYDWFIRYSPVNAVGVLLLALPTTTPGERAGSRLLGAAILLLLIGVAVQLKLFLYHYGAVLPLTAVLASWGYWELWRRLRPRWYGALILSAMVVVLALARPRTVPTFDPFVSRAELRLAEVLHPDRRDQIRDRLYSLYDYSAHNNRVVAAWIRAETPASAPIYVWGFTPELYVAAARPAASRYIYDVPQRAPWSRTAARDELMRDLGRSRPLVIVVEHGDAVPQVTGTFADSATELVGFEALRSLVASEYRRVFQAGEFDVYRRID
jgi:hypothetical protein